MTETSPGQHAPTTRPQPGHALPALLVLPCLLAPLANAGDALRAERLEMPFEHIGARAETPYPFLTRGERYALALSAAGWRVVVDNGPEARDAVTAVHVTLVGANARARIDGGKPLPGVSHYLLGKDKRSYVVGVPQHETLSVRDAYPGVDAAFYRGAGVLEHDFALAPGAQPEAIRLRIEGTRGARIDKNGDLVFTLEGGELVYRAPEAYQLYGSKVKDLTARWVERGKFEYGFEVGKWDRYRTLFIQPAIDYVAFIAGGGNESGRAIAVDPAASAYVAGTTLGFNTTLPTTPGALQPGPGGGTTDAFVVKLSPDGSAIRYAAFLGGSDADRGNGIAVDESGHAYVTGGTFSTDFPRTAGAFQSANAGRYDAFVSKLAADGSALVYSTYLGGNGNGLGDDEARGIALGPNNEAFVTGVTGSGDFPVTQGAAQTAKGGFGDAFVVQLKADGSGLHYATFLGGNGADAGNAIALHGYIALVAGETSGAFPTTADVLGQNAPGGGLDGFVARLGSNGATVDFATYLGGSGVDRANALAVDAGGRAYVAGETGAGFPVTPGAFQATPGGSLDAYAALLTADGAKLVFSTLLGGSQLDRAHGIGVDAEGYAYLTGETRSQDFPVRDGALSTCQGGGLTAACADAFFARLDSSGSRLATSSFLGGGLTDAGLAIAVTGAGDAYLTGRAGADLPATGGGYRHTSGAFAQGVFVVKYANRSTAGCAPTLPTHVYHNSQIVRAEPLLIGNQRLEDLALSVKVAHRAPDGTLTPVFSRGWDASLVVPARGEVDVGPVDVLSIGALTPRGEHAMLCRIFVPGTGALLAETVEIFEVQ